MATSSDKPAERRFFSFFRRSQPWREIFGYHVGDIQETQPVAVAAGSTVVGDIYAPQIMVVGLLSGSAISREVVVQSTGQIWGDIYAARLHLEPGGLIRGWINTLTEADYAHWLNGRSPLNGLAPAEIGDGPVGLEPEHDHRRDGETLDALRLLQMETAVALAARIELEETFDQRLAEISGETTNLLAATREELKSVKAELSAWQDKAGSRATALQQREAQLERQAQELALAQQTLSNTNEELEQLRQTHARLESDHGELAGAKSGVDQELAEAQIQIELLTNRVHNIETALKDSLDHSSDQEDALLRWQELAQRSEAQVKGLEKDLQTTRQQIEESGSVIDRLRSQRQQIEEEWNLAQVQIEELQQETAVAKQHLSNKDATIQALTEKYEQLEAENRETIQTLTAQHEAAQAESQAAAQLLIGQTAALRAEAASHVEEIERLQAEMEPLRRRNEALMRQMQMAKEKFFKQEETAVALRQQNADLEKQWRDTQAELDRISQQPTRMLSSPQIEALQREADQAQETLAETQAAHEAALAERDEWQQKAETLARQTENFTAKQRQIESELRQKRAQLEASEEDLHRHLQETAAQGRRLAESQATLIEREIQLQQAQQTLAKQQQLIKQIKQVAGQKISELEAALAKAQQ
jgi:chromosome segregation ATPase